jgi:2-furoyl-CoA dehydrogenase 2Fe-2S iron sulfur subunit
MSFTDFLARNPKPSTAEIREVLSGHLCRCTGYAGIVAAIEEVAAKA